MPASSPFEPCCYARALLHPPSSSGLWKRTLVIMQRIFSIHFAADRYNLVRMPFNGCLEKRQALCRFTSRSVRIQDTRPPYPRPSLPIPRFSAQLQLLNEIRLLPIGKNTLTRRIG